MNTEINLRTITNFDAHQRPVYEAAIKESGHSTLVISDHATGQSGQRIRGCLALKLPNNNYLNLNAFWDVFNRIKAETPSYHLRPDQVPAPKSTVFSQDELTALRELVDGAYEVIDCHQRYGDSGFEVWRQAWLKRAEELVP